MGGRLSCPRDPGGGSGSASGALLAAASNRRPLGKQWDQLGIQRSRQSPGKLKKGSFPAFATGNHEQTGAGPLRHSYIIGHIEAFLLMVVPKAPQHSRSQGHSVLLCVDTPGTFGKYGKGLKCACELQAGMLFWVSLREQPDKAVHVWPVRP